MGRHTRREALTALGVLLFATPLATACNGGTPKKTTPCPFELPTPTMKIALNTIWVNVWNANGTDGLASQIAIQLRWRGLHIVATGNDPESGNYPLPTYAQIRYGAGGKQIALTLATQVKNSTLRQDDRTNPSVDLVLGAKFALQPVPPPPPSAISLNVYNAYVLPDTATALAVEMTKRGFHIANVGNDPKGGYFPDSTAAVRYGSQGEPAAQRVALQVQSVKMVNSNFNDSTVDLVIGSKWTDSAIVPAPQATSTPSRSTGC